MTITPAPSTSPEHQIATRWTLLFADARTELDRRIIEQGLIVLGMVDTTAVLHGAGMEIPGVQQVLAFHPRFMRVLLETDSAAVVEAPLKFTLIERDGGTEVRCADPASTFGRYNPLASLAGELHAIATRILA